MTWLIYLGTLGALSSVTRSMEGVMKMTQTAFINSLVDRFDIQYEA